MRHYETASSPNRIAESLGRITSTLSADDPHRACLQRHRDAQKLTSDPTPISEFCDCIGPHKVCTNPCCR